MNDELQRWGDDAPTVFQRAKSAYVGGAPGAEQLERMLAHVERVAPLPVAAGHAWLSSKLLWLVVGLGALGLALFLARPAPREAAKLPARPTHEPLPPTSVVEIERPASAQPSAASAPARRAHAVSASDPLAELQLLDRARRVMASNPARALVLSEEHRRYYAHGQFAEERELLAIEALVALHKRDAAEQRARAFTRAHPNSVHAHRLALILQRDAP